MGLDNIRLGKRIKAARKRIGLSQLVLSEALDCTPNHLSYIENGNRSLSLAKFVQLANALGTSADELLMDSLDNVSKAMNHQCSSIMADCSEREKRVLLSILLAIKAKQKHIEIPYRNTFLSGIEWRLQYESTD